MLQCALHYSVLQWLLHLPGEEQISSIRLATSAQQSWLMVACQLQRHSENIANTSHKFADGIAGIQTHAKDFIMLLWHPQQLFNSLLNCNIYHIHSTIAVSVVASVCKSCLTLFCRLIKISEAVCDGSRGNFWLNVSTWACLCLKFSRSTTYTNT